MEHVESKHFFWMRNCGPGPGSVWLKLRASCKSALACPSLAPPTPVRVVSAKIPPPPVRLGSAKPPTVHLGKRDKRLASLNRRLASLGRQLASLDAGSSPRTPLK